MTYTPENILVTGGAGFIGSNFVRYFLNAHPSAKIINLDLLTYAGSLENLAEGINSDRHIFIKGDICDASLVSSILSDFSIDTIVHFAAESHVDRSITGPGEFVRTNIQGTYVLLEAARQYWQVTQKLSRDELHCSRRFHHISTDEVYGTLGASDAPFTEATPYAPNSPYSASKASSDHLVRAYYHTYGLPVTTTNCSNNYGPYQHNEKFIPTIIRSCLNQIAIPVYGRGENVRDWLYVEDHCTGIDRVISEGRLGETYNIGGWNEWRNIDIVLRICEIMDRLRPLAAPHNRLVSYVTDRPGHDWRYAIDATKMNTTFGWRPSESFETGIEKTVQWCVEHWENSKIND